MQSCSSEAAEGIFLGTQHNVGIDAMQEATERLLVWEQDWRKSSALESWSRPGSYSPFYNSLQALSVYAVL